MFCSNLLGDVTCTVSLIVNDAKHQESKKDFRHVLKKPTAVKQNSGPTAGGEEQVNALIHLRLNWAESLYNLKKSSALCFSELRCCLNVFERTRSVFLSERPHPPQL